MQIFGHRGSSGTAPENTLQAFRQAMAAGADGIELDVQATADGIAVVIHDSDLSRTTNGAGRIQSLTLAEVQQLDAGGGERVPTLDEIVGLLAGAMTIDLEIKQPDIEDVVLEVLHRHPSADWFISCFKWGVLQHVRQLDSSASLWPLATVADEALFTIAAELRSPGLALRHTAYTEEVAERCAAAGLEVGVWTVNDPKQGGRLKQLGASVLMTDYPAMMREALAG